VEHVFASVKEDNAIGVEIEMTSPFIDPLEASSSTFRSDTMSASTPTSQPASTNPQMPVSDWKATSKEGFGVASRFMKTLLKRVPECIDTNPVKTAFAIAKVIIHIKDVSRHLCISCTR
jgi:hypothetical protein